MIKEVVSLWRWWNSSDSSIDVITVDGLKFGRWELYSLTPFTIIESEFLKLSESWTIYRGSCYFFSSWCYSFLLSWFVSTSFSISESVLSSPVLSGPYDFLSAPFTESFSSCLFRLLTEFCLEISRRSYTRGVLLILISASTSFDLFIVVVKFDVLLFSPTMLDFGGF